MNQPRSAVPQDAEEIIRLRKVMIDSQVGPSTDVTWMPSAIATLRGRLGAPDSGWAAFVVDRAESGGLAACAVGIIDHRLGGPGNPTGTTGYVFSVATDPDMRRRGLSRACMEALLGWFREREVGRVDLRASVEGEPLYASLGFVQTPDPAMRLTL